MFIFYTTYFLSARKSWFNNRNLDAAQQLLFRLFLVIVKASVTQANYRSKKGFSVVFGHETRAMKQEPWNHETAQINLNRQRIVFGDDKDQLLPILFFKTGDGQLK